MSPAEDPWFLPADALDRDRFAREMRKSPPRKTYLMFFTPRSGSSWFTDVATGTGLFGNPAEAFNPSWFRDVSRAFNATDMVEFCDILRRRRQSGGVCGAQLTWYHLNKLFNRPSEIIDLMQPDAYFWLIRADIVRQAVSLAKMVATGVAHSPQSSKSDIRDAEKTFEYDTREIRKWVDHILTAEMRTEQFFDRHGITPFRMTYERNMSLPVDRVLRAARRHLGFAPGKLTDVPTDSAHRKLGTRQNTAYAKRFRTDDADYVREVEHRRAGMLAKFGAYRDQFDRRAEV